MTPKERAKQIVDALLDTSDHTDFLRVVMTQIYATIEEERWECAEAVKRVANEINTENEAEYRGYKNGIVASLAAIRARGKEQG